MWRRASGVRWIKLKENDEVVEVAIVEEDDKYVLVVTQNGMWKISDIEEYRNQSRWWSWVKALSVTAKTWKLVWAMILNEEQKANSEILMMSKSWQTIRLSLKWIRTTSRVTQWVILTKIKSEDDEIVRASVIMWENEKEEENKEINLEIIDEDN